MEPGFVKLKDIKPVLSGYLREAQYILSPSKSPDDKVIHDVRVLMKKSRATLKLVITQVDQEIFAREYNALREVGRVMRTWRETSVYRKTLKDLKKNNPDVFSMLAENEQLGALMNKAEPSPELTENQQNDLVKIRGLLHRSESRIRFFKMDGLEPRILLQELEKTYDIVVNDYLNCRNNPKTVNLHEFRKKAKDFLYQLYFFRPFNPPVVKSLEKKLDTLTQNLGKYNDLAQIIRTIGYKYGNSGNPVALDELIVIIRNIQDRYLLKVWPQAYKTFCPGQKLENILRIRQPLT